jgi:hypothetical protein
MVSLDALAMQYWQPSPQNDGQHLRIRAFDLGGKIALVLMDQYP